MLCALVVMSLAAVAEAQPTFSKAFAPATIGPGSTSTLTFTIANGSVLPVTDLAFTDNLPAGVSIATPSSAATSCVGGTLTALDGGGTISYSDGAVGGSSSCVVTVNVTSSTVATHSNVSGDLTSSAGNSGTASADLTVATDRPGFTKSFSPSSIGFGGRTTLTFTIDNTANSGILANMAFTDTLPGGLTVANPANTSTDCTGATLTAVPGTSVVSLLGALLFGGTSCTVSVDVAGSAAGTFANVSSDLLASSGGPQFSCGKATAALTVTSDRLLLTKAFTDDPLTPGSTGTLEFTIRNTDRTQTATNLVFTDDLDATLTGLVATGLPMGDVCGSGSSLTGSSTVTLTGGTLAPGDSCTFSVSIQVPAAATTGFYPNTTSTISGDLGGSSVVSNPATDSLLINEAPTLTKAFQTNPVGAGDAVDLQFTITNTSATSQATSIGFQDPLGTFLSGVVVSSLPAAGFCGAGSLAQETEPGGIYTLVVTGANLVAGDSCTFTVGLQVPAGASAGPHVNTTGAISGTVNGTLQVGQPATDTLNIVSTPTLQKEFTDDPVLPGGTATLEFTISHADTAAADATAISFTDDLDATLTGLAAIGLPQNDVCGTGSQLTGTSSLSFTGGTLAPGATCTFSVTVQVPAAALPGGYDNVTSELSASVSGVTTTRTGASDQLQVAGLTLAKEFIDDPVIPGQTATLRFTIDNSSPTLDATGIFFTDSLTSALPGLAALAPLPTTPCGPGSSLTGTTNLIFTGGEVAANSTCAFDVTVQVPAAATSGSYGNVTSNMIATVGGSSVTLDPASDLLEVNSSVLELTKTFTDDPVSEGDTVTLELTITNLDPDDTITAITLTDDLDAALTGLSATGLPQNDVCGTGSQLNGVSLLTLTGGTLAGGGSCTFSATLQVPASVPSTSAVNTTSAISGLVGGLAVDGPPASDTLQLVYIDATKSFGAGVPAGGTDTLSFTLTNLSPTQSAGDLRFSDDLDAVLSGLVAIGLPQSDVCGTGSILAGSSVVDLVGGSLAPGDSCTFDVTVQAPVGAVPGTYPNTTSEITDSGLLAGDPATADLTVVPPPLFGKSFAPDPTIIGGTTTLTLTIDNTASTIAATNLDFTDNLPAGLTVAPVPNASATCTGGALTASSGSSTVSYTGGEVAAGSTCTVVVDLLAGAAGNLVNVAGPLTSASGDSGVAEATLRVNPPPGFTKGFAPNPVANGGNSTLTLTIDNSPSTVAASLLDVTDNLPAGLLVATPPNASTTCTGGTLTAVAGAGSISYSGGSLAAGAACTVTVDVTTTAAGDLVNTTGDLTSSLGNSGPASGTLRADPQPALAKAFAPNPIGVGGVSTLTLTIDNSGSTQGATALDVTDNLPAGMEVAGTPNASTTCTGGTLSAVAGSSVISYTGGSVSAGGTCSIVVDVTTTNAGDLINTTGDLTSSLGNSGPASDTLRSDPQPGFSKSFAPNPIAVGETSTLTLTIDNTGSTVAATSLDVTDVFPSGLVVATTPNGSTTCTGGTLTATAGAGSISYSGGTVSAGGTCTVTVDVTAAAAGDYANTTGALTSSLGSSGTASDSLRVNPVPVFSKAFAPNPIAVGDTATLTLAIDNTGSTVSATGLDVTDTFPAGLEVSATPNASTTCTGGTLTAAAGAGSISYSGGTVAAGATCTVAVDVTAMAAGDLVNTTGDLTSSLGSSGPATDTLRSDPQPGFAKAFSPVAIPLDGVSTLTLTIDNSGSSQSATGLDVTDNLPAGMEVAATPNASTTCTGGTLTATAGNTTISYSGGSVPVAGTCTVSVDVTGTTVGTLSNTTGELTSSLGSSGTAAADLTVVEGPGFTKAFAPTAVAIDGVSTLTLTIDNTGSVLDATGLDVTDNLPAGMEVAASPNAASTCTGGTLTATVGAASISYTGGTVVAGSTCTVSVDVIGTTAGTLTNTTGELTSSLGSSGTAVADLTVVAAPLFTKALAPAAVPVDGVSTLTLTIDNTASALDATGLSVTDTFPAGMEVASTPNAATTCTGGTLTASTGAGSISYSAGTVAAGASCTVTVDVTGTAVGTLANTTGELTSSLGSSGTASADLVVDPAPAFDKAFAPTAISIDGDVSTLTLTIDNSGSTQDATNLDVADAFPAGLEVAGTPNASTTCTGGTLTAPAGAVSITYAGGTVAAGATCAVTVDVTATAEGVLSNTTGELTSSLGSSGTATADLTVDPVPSFNKAFSPTSIAVNGLSTLTLTIDNSGSSQDATGLDVTDTFPAGMEVAATPNATTTCTGGTLTAPAGSGSIGYSGGSVAAGASCTITVDVTGTAEGTLTNTTGELTSSLGSSGTATADLDVETIAAFTVSKTFVPDPVLRGGEVVLEYTITNASAVFALSNIGFTDDLDSALSGLAAVTLPTGTVCGGGTLTGGSLLTFAGGNLAPSGSCTFQATLAVPADAVLGVVTSASSTPTADVTGAPVDGQAAVADLQVTYLEFTKAFVGEANPGGTVPLEFTITNPDAANGASQITFTDDLDAVLAGLTAIDVPQSDVCGVGSLLDGSSLLELTDGNLAAGGSCTFAVLLQVPVDAAIGDVENITSPLEAVVGATSTIGDVADAATDTLSVQRRSIPTLGLVGLLLLIGLVAVLGWRFIR